VLFKSVSLKMGHLINPISTRLGFNSFWLSTWSSFKPINYSYGLMLDTVLRNLVFWLFADSSVAHQLGVVGFFFSHFKIIRRNNKILIFIFLFLNSSKVLASQSVEVDPGAVDISSTLSSTIQNYDTIKNDVLPFPSVVNRLVYQIKTKYRQSNSFNLVYSLFNLFLKDILSFSFTKLFCFNKHFFFLKPTFSVNFLDDVDCIKSNFISRFIARRLSFGFDLNRIIFPIVSDLSELIESRQSTLKGFKISCSGRFTKTQMASYSWEKFGPVPLNNFNCYVDYSLSKACMKYGMCGIKVWLFTEHKPFRSFRLSLSRNFYFSRISRLFVFNKQFAMAKMFLFFLRFLLLKKLFVFSTNHSLAMHVYSKNLELSNEFFFRLLYSISSKFIS